MDLATIETLAPREHVRLRKGMYCGNTDTPNQLLLEIFSNSLDEHNIGHGDVITVTIDEENGVVSCTDNGNGFPLNDKRSDGLTTLQASFEMINTSGKFSDDGVYKGVSLGLNGLGGKLTNFLSCYLNVISWNNGHYEEVHYKDGIREFAKYGPLSEHQEIDTKSGTKVTFKPDKQFFTSDKTSIKHFNNFFNDICCMCPNLTVILNDKIIHHDTIEDIIENKCGKSKEIINNHFVYENDNFKVTMTFTSSGSANIVSYVNYGLTDSGPHITGIKSTITRVFNTWAKNNGLLKEKDKNLDGNSIQEGILLVCNILSTGVVYDAQVKSRISKMDTSFLSDFAQQLEVWLDNNPDDASAILQNAIVARKAAEAAKKARAAVKKKAEEKKDKLFKLPTTLTDCWTKDRSEAELFICEGKSAAAGLVAARDAKYQAVYGVRGKMLSVLKTTPAQILKNQEINNLIQALGLECDNATAKLKYDKKKLRYDKIIAAADAK